MVVYIGGTPYKIPLCLWVGPDSHANGSHWLTRILSRLPDRWFGSSPVHGRRKRAIVNLSCDGQTAIPEVVELYTRRIVKDDFGAPIGLYPWRAWEKDTRKRPVAIYPGVMSGRLVTAGTRVPVSMLNGEYLAGKEPKRIARDHGLSLERVTEASSHLDTEAA